MTYKTDRDIMLRVREHLESALAASPCDWFVIAAQGSMNYGMMDEESDIDTKLLTIPSLEELVLNKKPVNTVHIVEPTDEHCDMKDVREYFKIFRKSNINFVEILFSDYWIANPKYIDLWLEMRNNAEELARMNPYAAVSAMKGMASQKLHCLCHEYPSRMPWIKKYGYDPKQLSHLARITYFINSYVSGEKYKDCIYSKSEEWRNFLLQCKRNGNGRSLDEAKEYANLCFDNISMVADAYKEKVSNKNDEKCDKFLNDTLYKLISRSLREEFIEEDWE